MAEKCVIKKCCTSKDRSPGRKFVGERIESTTHVPGAFAGIGPRSPPSPPWPQQRFPDLSHSNSERLLGRCPRNEDDPNKRPLNLPIRQTRRHVDTHNERGVIRSICSEEIQSQVYLEETEMTVIEPLSSPASTSPQPDVRPDSSVLKSRETSSAHSNHILNGASSPVDTRASSIHDYNFSGTYDESSTQSEHETFTDDEVAQTQESASSRSSISSLPASVTPSMMKCPPDAMTPTKSPLVSHGRMGSLSNSIQSGKRRVEKDHDSPFRHPSSIIAMQMRDEDETMSQRRRDSRMTSRMSSFSTMTSTPRSPSKRTSRSMNSSPQKSKPKKEYPLVLLHCTLLPPVLPLQTKVSDPILLQEILPQEHWRRWKLLNDKVTDNGEVSTRGVLIPHPKGDYDLLEERLLESLELAKPRIRSGHFLGPDESKKEEEITGRDGAEDIVDPEQGSKCPDCGSKILEDLDRDRKWEIKVYAANGLMRAGAWSAAWNEMEKVDVEVGVWLPEDVRRQIETTLHDISITAEQQQPEPEPQPQPADTPEEIRRREIYGDSRQSQDRIDGLFDDPVKPTESPRPERRHRARHHQSRYHAPEPDLKTLCLNYIEVLSQDRRNIVIAVLSIVVLFFALSRSPGAEPAKVSLEPLPVMSLTTMTATSPTMSQQCTPPVKSSDSQILRNASSAPTPEPSAQQTLQKAPPARTGMNDEPRKEERKAEDEEEEEMEVIIDENDNSEELAELLDAA